MIEVVRLFLTWVAIATISSGVAQAQITTEYSFPTPNAEPHDIAVAENGDLWVTLPGVDKIARVTPAGVITEFNVPRPPSQSFPLRPGNIIIGPDSNIWFTNQQRDNVLGRITPSGNVTEVSIALAGQVVGRPRDLAVGPDGNIWFLTASSQIGVVKPDGGRVVTPFLGLPLLDTLVAGPNRVLWGLKRGAAPLFGNPGVADRIYRFDELGQTTVFTSPTQGPGGAQMATDADGNMWITQATVGQIARTTLSGGIIEYGLTHRGVQPFDIALGPDGDMWFTMRNANKIGRMSRNGTLTEFDIATPNAQPQAIAAGKDGSIWYVQFGTNKIVRFLPPITGQQIANVNGSSNTETQSFLRFVNTGRDSNFVSLSLHNPSTGQVLAIASTREIAAGSAAQYSIKDIEDNAQPASFPRLVTYGISLQTSMRGYFQHVLWRPADGTLTNASTCSQGVTAPEAILNNVHSSRMPSGYPSAVVVTRTGLGAAPATLGLYDATNGARLGVIETATIPSGGSIALPISVIESGSGLTSSPTTPHYNVKLESAFDGYLQHTVTNARAGVVTDMTTVCALNARDNSSERKIMVSPVVAAQSVSSSKTGEIWYRAGRNVVGRIGSDGNRVEYSYTDGWSILPSRVAGVPNGGAWVAYSDSFYRLAPDGKFSRHGRFWSHDQFPDAPPRGYMGLVDNGDVWVTHGLPPQIYKYTPSKDDIQQYEHPQRYGSNPRWIPDSVVIGPDGSLWYRDLGSPRISRVTLSGIFTDFDVPGLTAENPFGSNNPALGFGGIAWGPNGNIWYAAYSPGRIGQLNTVTGVSQDFNLPTGSKPRYLVTGGDGNIWYTADSGRIGRVTPSGSVSEFTLPFEVSFDLQGIAQDAAGDVWFTTGGRLVRLNTMNRVSGVYGDSVPGIKSFVRLSNTGAAADVVKLDLVDPATGSALAEWTSPTIAPGASAQFALGTIEASAVPGTFSRKANYVLRMKPRINGTLQHVLWRPSDGTLSNTSTCSAGVVARGNSLVNVHSSLLDAGYPSSVTVSNTGRQSSTATLGIFDAMTGTRLGTYVSPEIPSAGQTVLSIIQIESGAKVPASATRFHYNIRLEGAFSGYLQHTVTNKQAGVITDMTTVCVL